MYRLPYPSQHRIIYGHRHNTDGAQPYAYHDYYLSKWALPRERSNCLQRRPCSIQQTYHYRMAIAPAADAIFDFQSLKSFQHRNTALVMTLDD